MAFVLDVNLRIAEILGIQKVEAALSQIKGSATTGTAGTTGAGGVAAGIKAQATAATALTIATKGTTIANTKLATSQTKVARSTKAVATGMTGAATKADSFGASIKIAATRYSAFLAATVVPFAALGGIAKATAAVVEFEAAMLKVTQVMGRTTPQMAGMRDIVLDLAASTGTSATELARVAQVLAQAGQRGDQLTESLSALSRVPLTPSFETIDAAIQGSIAALNQFRSEGLSTTEVLDVLTAVSNKFAASSEDIAKGVSRGGAAFEAIGGTFREFVGVFTTIRQATRESAETVGTFMKTISSRLADPKIVNFLEGKGIRISEAIEAGNPVEAIKRIAAALQNTTSIQDRIEIGTKLGGRRQISRLLALVSNIDVMNDALNTANGSAGEFGKVAAQGLESMQAQLNILVQEMNKLVQSLAQPLFIPIIRGATQLGKAFVSIVDFIKPIIPTFTTIIGFASGFKLLSVSIGAASKALAFMSTISIGGGIPGVLSALNGGVAGGVARQRVQARLGGGLGSSVVAGGLGARAGGGVGALAGSSIGQLGLAAGVILGANKLSESFRKAEDSTGLMASEFLKAASIIGIAASIISGKSITGAIGSALGLFGPWGAALATGVVALGAFTFAATKAVDLDVQNILDAAAKKVSETEVPKIAAGDIGTLQDVTSTLGADALGGLRGTVDRFEEGFSGVLASTVERLGNLFAGEGLITINDSDAQKMVQDIVGNNPALLNEILRSSIEQFGAAGLEGGLDQILTKAFSGNLEAAQRIRQALISQAGGLAKIARGIRQSQIDAEVSKLANAIEKAGNEFRTLRVPVQLTSQLSLLSDAVGKSVRAIDTNISLFDKLSQNIGRDIGIAKPETEFSIEAVRKIAGEGRLGEFGDLAGFEELDGFTKDIVNFGTGLDRFLKSIVASKAKSETLLSALQKPQADPFEVVDEFLAEFQKTLPQDLPPEALALFRATASNLTGKIREALVKDKGLLPDSDILEKVMEDALGGQQPFFEAGLEVFTRWLNSQSSALGLQLKAQELKANIRLGNVNVPTTLVQSIAQDLESQGFDTRGLADAQLSIADARDEIIGLGTNADLISTILQETIQATQAYGKLLREETEAKNGTGTATQELILSTVEAGSKLLALQELLTKLRRAAEQAPAAFTERRETLGLPPDPIGLQQIEQRSSAIIEELNKQRQLAEVDTAISISQAFVSPAETFANALTASAEAVKIFTSALTVKDIEAGLSIPAPKVTPEGRPFVERIKIETSGDAQQEAFSKSNAQSAVFGANLGIVNQTLRQVAEEIASSNARKQFLTGDFEASGQSNKLARQLRESNLLADIPKILAESSDIINLGDVAKGTTSSLIEQSQEAGVFSINFLGALNSLPDDLASRLSTLITLPSVADDPGRLVPSLSTDLQDALRGLEIANEKVAEPDATPRVFEQVSSIQQSASELRNAAQATVESTENIRSAAQIMQDSGLSMTDASQRFSGAADKTVAVADIQREVSTPDQTVSAVVAEGGGTREAALGTTEAVIALADRVDAVTTAVAEQTLQNAELAALEKEEPLAVEGLSDNTDALISSNELSGKTQEGITGLGDDMEKIASAMQEGVGIDIATMSQVNVNVQGLSEVAKEFSSELQAVAEQIVKKEIGIVLSKLAAASGNSELANTFGSVI